VTGLRSAIGRIASKHVRVVSKALGSGDDRKEPSIGEPMMNTDENASETEDMDIKEGKESIGNETQP